MIEVREAADAESQDALAVHEAAFAKHQATYHARPDDAARQSARLREGVRVVAVDSGRIVGTVQYADHKKHIHLLGLAVHPAYQRRGIARLLIHWVAERSASLGHRLLVADTIEETGNVPIFQRLGFIVTERAVTDQFDSDTRKTLHCVILQRELPGTSG